MRIALIQQTASTDRDANRKKGLEALEDAAEKGAQLICYAELAFEPFYPQMPASGDVTGFAEPIPGPTTEAFAAAAARHGVAVVLNLFELDGNRTYDSSPVIGSGGDVLGKTRMVHVPDYACFHERGYYTPGNLGAPVYDTGIGRVGVAICYDRHYPEYMRALALAGAEVVVVPQAGAVDEWPAGLFEAEMRAGDGKRAKDPARMREAVMNMRALAAVALYRLTGEPAYHEAFRKSTMLLLGGSDDGFLSVLAWSQAPRRRSA